MKVGMTLQLTSFGGKPDRETYQDELSLMEMSEALGFDSVWTLDHHFTGYVMSPDPVQLLSYVAGRTKRIQLGTAVIVLPWHDPVEIAEKIALLDVISGGRTAARRPSSTTASASRWKRRATASSRARSSSAKG
jgi:alkanesulfonate monooxygenase SsuD/methylene tetrahydromethanopterin reductase-like flavin-dependent oxidoreductase (luciferase family)